MIQFKDFSPQRFKKGGLFKSDEFESLPEVMDRLNKWKNQHLEYKILSIETVVLPNIHHTREDGSEDTDLLMMGETPTKWYQFMRVWYEE